MAYVKLAIPPGLITDQTEYSASPAWVDGVNFRFINGYPNRVGGYRIKRFCDLATGSNALTLTDAPREVFHWHHVWTNSGEAEVTVVGQSGGYALLYLPSGRTEDCARIQSLTTPAGAAATVDEWTITSNGPEILMSPFNNTATGNDNIVEPFIVNPAVQLGTFSRSNWSAQTGAQEVPWKIRNFLISKAHGHIVCFGCSGYDTNHVGQAGRVSTGNYNPRLIRWSSPYTFDFMPSDTDRAGDLELPEPIVAAAQTAVGQILVSTTNTIFIMDFVGGQTVYRLSFGASDCGAISKRSIVSVNDEMFWFSRQGFFHYRGTVSEIPCPVKFKTLADVKPGTEDKIYGVHDSKYSEVKWFYQSNDGSDIDSCVALNYRTGAWHFEAWDRTAWLDRQAGLPNPIAFDRGGQRYEHDDFTTGNAKFEVSAFIETSPLELVGASQETIGGTFHTHGSQLMHINEFVPDLDLAEGLEATVELEGRTYPNDSDLVRRPRTGERYVCRRGVGKFNFKMRTRQVKFKISVASNQSGKCNIGLNRLDVQSDGARSS